MNERSIISIVLLFSCSVVSTAGIIINFLSKGSIIFSSLICSLFVLAWSCKRIQLKFNK